MPPIEDEVVDTAAPASPTSDDASGRQIAPNDPANRKEPADGGDDDDLSAYLDDEDGAGDTGDGQEETEEIEFGGKKYKLPKELKSGFMMQSDYTKKTQEIADRGRELEERAKSLDQQSKATEELITDRAKVAIYDREIAEYQKVDWDAYEREHPEDAQAHWRRFTALKEERREADARIQKAQTEGSEKAQREFAKRVEDAQSVLRKDIKNWGPELAGKLTSFAKDQGWSREELISMNADPRAIKLLHRAWLGDQLIKKQRTAARGGTETVVPLTTVPRGKPRSSGQKSLAEMSEEEYAAARKAGRGN